jgi:hypothetical protein
MGWVNDARRELAAGRQVQVRPFGGSMRGRIESGQMVTIAPIGTTTLQPEDIVLVEWRGNYILHLVKEVTDNKLLIGNNLGKINGWVDSRAVIGKVVAVEEAKSGYTVHRIARQRPRDSRNELRGRRLCVSA